MSPATEKSLLTLRNVDVRYGAIHAVRRVSLHVNQGEIVTLIGANGAGKTTLLCTISGLLSPASGEILFDGKSIAGAAPDAIVRRGISQSPEGRRIFGPLSVADNLRLGAYVRHDEDADIEQDLQAMYTMFPILHERRRQSAGALSGGEQQMLAMARALMARPRLLLLDEPSMGLAPKVTREIFRHVVALRREQGLTVLLVEQNAKKALDIADRGYVIETGRIILQGPSQELLANRDVQRAYLGHDAGNDVENAAPSA